MKKENLIIGIVLTLLIIGGLIYFAGDKNGKTSEAKKGVAGSLIATDIFYDFGSISMKNGNVSRIFSIKNTGAQPIMIEKVYTSCMCTTATFIKGSERQGPFGMPGHGIVPSINTELKPNEEAMIEVVFDPNAHGPAGIGPIERLVRIEHSSGDPLELSFKALVTP